MAYTAPPRQYGRRPHQSTGTAGGPSVRRGLVIVVGVLITAAVAAVMAFLILWVNNMNARIGSIDKNDLKDLPGPKSLGVIGTPFPPTAATTPLGGQA